MTGLLMHGGALLMTETDEVRLTRVLLVLLADTRDPLDREALAWAIARVTMTQALDRAKLIGD